MTNIVELTLAALVGLASNFHAGVENLNNKSYDKAIIDFTAVVQSGSSVAEMQELALLYRAEAQAGQGNKVAAMQDATNLLMITSDVTRKSKALAIYRAQGGALQDLRPKESPRAAFARFLALCLSNDVAGARQLISGPLRNTLDVCEKANAGRGRERTIFTEFTRNPESFLAVSESFDDTNQTATLTLSVGNGQVLATLGLVRQGGAWSAASLVSYEMLGRDRRTAQTQSSRNLANLRVIGQALRQQAADGDGATLPARLEDLKSAVTLNNPQFHLFTDAASGKQLPFLYRAGLKLSDAPDLLVAATPMAVEGTRYVLQLSGAVMPLAEEQFVRMADEQKWVIAALVKKADVSAEIAAEVTALIPKLADADAKVRAAAKTRLQEIGAPAAPFLREQKKHADPEIRATVRELLKMN
jgi:hypothetical protein